MQEHLLKTCQCIYKNMLLHIREICASNKDNREREGKSKEMSEERSTVVTMAEGGWSKAGKHNMVNQHWHTISGPKKP